MPLSKELCIITRDCIGKGENWVMTGFEGNASLCFLGSTKDIAYVEVKCYGYPTKPQMNLMTRKSLHALRRRTWYSEETNLCCLLPD